MKAAEVMSSPVVTVAADASIAQAVHLMLDNRISGLPVVDNVGELVGMVTEGDFLRRTETGTEKHRPSWLEFLIGPGRIAGEYVRTHSRKVQAVMTKDVITVDPETELDEVVALMEKHHVKRVPVVEGNKIAGIVTRANLLRALAGSLGDSAAETVDDAELRQRVTEALAAQSWVPHAAIHIRVRKGVVELRGTVLDPREGEALRVLVENLPGVKGVKDQLCWIEPISASIVMR